MTTDTKPYRLELSFPWTEKIGAGAETVEIDALHSRDHYGALRGENEISATRHTAKLWAFAARSVITFADLTGLRPCDDDRDAWKAVFGASELYEDEEEAELLWDAEPPGFDHTRLWRAAHGRYVVTTEPYDERCKTAAAWCAERGWACEIFPPGVGLWNPDGVKGTRFVLMAPAKNGASIAPMISILLAGMPRWGAAE